jgi:long-chain acyl-CoA synthetase
MSDSIGSALARVAAQHPTQIAISSIDRSITYRELDQMSGDFARALCARDAAPGKSTALVASGIEYIVAYFGIVRAGNRAVPIEARFRGEQLRRILESTNVSLMVIDPSGQESVASMASWASSGGTAIPHVQISPLLQTPVQGVPLPEVTGDRELCVLFSSGSTGTPKGVVLTHEAGIARAQLMARVFGPGKRHLVFTPLAYAYGLIDGTLCPLLHGGQTILLGMYNPSRLKEMVTRFQPQIILGVPFLYKHLGSMAIDLLAGLPERQKCLYFTTGEPLPRAVMQGFMDRYGVPIRQSYGLSEISGISADLHDADPRLSRVGKLIPGVEIRIVEEQQPGKYVDAPMGELWVKRSQRFMKGYTVGSESGESRMGADYYRTGDLARVDEDGYLELFGRNDDFVMVAGVRIHPAEVENVLLAIPGVLEAAFVCERNPDTGDQTTRAYVVLDPARPRSVEDLLSKLKAELSPSRWPQHIEISAGLPRTDTGKLVRRRLVERKDERLVASAAIAVRVGEQVLHGQLLDVSRNGCMMLLHGVVAVGDPLVVSLTGGATETALSGVCRSSFDEIAGYRVGVEFSENDAVTIERFVKLL